MKNKYYALSTSDNGVADIYIFGDITSWEWLESDVSSYTLAKEIKELKDVSQINVHINSYGGEVAEGLAIYNSLKNHSAKVVTICDGFACSAASVVFMAGDERIMNNASLLMVHNAWMFTAGNSAQLRKDADDLDTITQASINAYMERVEIDEDKLKELLDNETWILPADALEMGFATSIINASSASEGKAAASVRTKLFKLVSQASKPDFITKKMNLPPAEPQPEPEPEPAPKENKTLKFFNALLGGKDENK